MAAEQMNQETLQSDIEDLAQRLRAAFDKAQAAAESPLVLGALTECLTLLGAVAPESRRQAREVLEVAEASAQRSPVSWSFDGFWLDAANEALEREERALRRTDGMLARILGSLNDAIWSVDAKTLEVVYVNGAAERVYGRSASEFYSRLGVWRDAIHPEDRDAVVQGWPAVLKKGVWEAEYRIMRPGGEVRWVRDRGQAARDADGNVVRVDGIATDITERKLAEQALRESESRYRQIFERNRAVKLLVDPETAAIVDANPAAADFYGYPLDVLKRMKVTDINTLPPDDLFRMYARVVAGQGSYFVFQHRRASGVVSDVEVNISPIAIKGKTLLHAIVHDISERRRTEAALQETSERLRRLAAHLESIREEQNAKIAREVHDELGGTLTVLKLGLASALHKAQGMPRVIEQLGSMLMLADSAIQTVKRISSSLRPNMLDNLGLAATVKAHLAEFSRLTGIAAEARVLHQVELPIERSTAVYRIIQEALTNVARHSGASRVKVSVRKNKAQLVVEVSDNGSGLSAKCLSKPDSYGVLGMRERTQYLGGELRIDNLPGAGAKLVLRVPLEP